MPSLTSSRPEGLFLADPVLDARVSARLVDVEVLLRESVVSDYPFVTSTARHLVDAGGKRFRPLLALLASEFGDPDAETVVPSAVVVELTHLATLYHDDVMDEARLRRGADSANARWDNTVAILTGDFLFARASDLLADLGPEAVRIQARTFERLCTGQGHRSCLRSGSPRDCCRLSRRPRPRPGASRTATRQSIENASRGADRAISLPGCLETV